MTFVRGSGEQFETALPVGLCNIDINHDPYDRDLINPHIFLQLTITAKEKFHCKKSKH